MTRCQKLRAPKSGISAETISSAKYTLGTPSGVEIRSLNFPREILIESPKLNLRLDLELGMACHLKCGKMYRSSFRPIKEDGAPKSTKT